MTARSVILWTLSATLGIGMFAGATAGGDPASGLCLSFGLTCENGCTRDEGVELYDNCYNSPGGCCYGRCGMYQCVDANENLCFQGIYFVALGLKNGSCNGDVRIVCDDDRGCSGATEAGR